MHKGRYGRRWPTQCLSVDATVPYFAPYWLTPLSVLFFYAGLPILTPGYGTWIAATEGPYYLEWRKPWADPVTGFHFNWVVRMTVRATLPGVQFDWGLTDPFGGSITGAAVVNPLAGFWAGPAEGLPVPTVKVGAFGLWTGGSFPWHYGTWHEKP